MARGRKIDLDCGEPFALAAADVIEARGVQVIEESHDVFDLSDIERVHDMRVATRRLRAAMEIFAPCFPRKRHKAAVRDVKVIADALGERRDRDVAIEALEAFADEVGPNDRAGVRTLIERLRREQQHANDELREVVTAKRLAALQASLDKLVAEARAVAGREAVAAGAREGL
jgi:CHAD domain-containing protein